jgi:tyrosyl-tRNA synthetase
LRWCVSNAPTIAGAFLFVNLQGGMLASVADVTATHPRNGFPPYPEVSMNIEEQVELLMQGTEYGDEELKKAMTNELRQRLLEAQKENRPLRVYCGFDPTHVDLHLGHTIPMRKLRQFQDLGQDVTFLIGSYTALVGDPSDKNKARPILTQEQVAENSRTYTEQAFRVLDREKTKIRYNGEWLSELSLVDLIRLGQNFTVQQFLARENFAKRFEAGEPIFLHETFYALMQGYDAVAQQTDVQVGGTDQLFNIIVAGRKLQEALGQKPLVGIITGILPGTDGVQRMSKSMGNIVPINTGAEDMYGKLMSIPDFAMGKYMRLVTRWSPHEIESIEKDIESGKLHPRDAKMRLAFEIASIFYSEADAHKAQDAFVKTFQQKEMPDEMPEYALRADQTVLDVILAANMAASKSEARRLLDQKGVRLDGETLERGDIPFPHPGVLQVGKRKFLRVIS